MDDVLKLQAYLDNQVDNDESDSESVSTDELFIICENSSDSSNLETTVLESNFDQQDLNINYTVHGENCANEDALKTIKECPNDFLKQAMILNVKKRQALETIAARLRQYLKDVQNQIMNLKNKNKTKQQKFIATTRIRLGMPYFKDKDMFPSPFNSDYHKLRINRDLPLQCYYTPKLWTDGDKTNLAKTVYEYICANMNIELRKKLKLLQEQDNKNPIIDELYKNTEVLSDVNFISSIAMNWINAEILDNDQIISSQEEIQNKINELQITILNNKDTNLQKQLDTKLESLKEEQINIIPKNFILECINNWNKKIDWFKVSTIFPNDRHSESECEIMWNCYISCKNSKKPWTKLDDIKLRNIVVKYNMENWESIATEMNINKSPYQCCIHFLSKLWDKCNKDKWTPDEEKFLKDVVKLCSVGDYIPWGKVALYFKDRIKSQIYHHYIYCLAPDIRKGRFSITEDILLLSLLKKYKSFSKVSNHFPNRTISQLRDKFKNIGEYSSQKWTILEDLKILEHVEKCGEKNWKGVELKRSIDSVRHRYYVLQKWISLNPGKSIHDVQRREKSKIENLKYRKRIHTINRVMEELSKSLENCSNPHEILNIKYIEDLMSRLCLDYKKMIKPMPKKALKECDLNDLITDFYRPTCKFVGRNKVINIDQDVPDSTERVKWFLNTLNVSLNIPTPEIINNHPCLDELDKEILKNLASIHNTSKNTNSANCNILTVPGTSKSSTTIIPNPKILVPVCNLPPNPTTLFGFRGLMLHNATLKEHANGYNSFEKYVKIENTTEKGIKYSRVNITKFLANYNEDAKQILIQERDIFQKRFKALFRWPSMMSLPYNKPPENYSFLSKISTNDNSNEPKSLEQNTETCQSDPPISSTDIKKPVKRKVGRPSGKNYKIELMNKARLRKRLKREDEPIENVAKR